MKKQRSLDNFPVQMIQIYEHTGSGKSILIPFPSKAKAEAMRFRFYELKAFLRKAQEEQPTNARIRQLLAYAERTIIKNPKEQQQENTKQEQEGGQENTTVWVLEMLHRELSEDARWLTDALSKVEELPQASADTIANEQERLYPYGGRATVPYSAQIAQTQDELISQLFTPASKQDKQVEETQRAND